MVYVNKGGQPREKAMIAAWALVVKYGATQKNVALVLGCSQATIANWVKEMNFRMEIQGLHNELIEADGYISQLQDELGYLLPNPN